MRLRKRTREDPGMNATVQERLRAAQARSAQTDAVVDEARQHTETNRELSESNHWMETIAALLGGRPVRP